MRGRITVFVVLATFAACKRAAPVPEEAPPAAEPPPPAPPVLTAPPGVVTPGAASPTTPPPKVTYEKGSLATHSEKDNQKLCGSLNEHAVSQKEAIEAYCAAMAGVEIALGASAAAGPMKPSRAQRLACETDMHRCADDRDVGSKVANARGKKLDCASFVAAAKTCNAKPEEVRSCRKREEETVRAMTSFARTVCQGAALPVPYGDCGNIEQTCPGMLVNAP